MRPADARPGVARAEGFSTAFWIKTGILAALFIMTFWPNLRRLWLKTNPFFGEPNWGHAIAVPVIGLYYLYTNRSALLSARSRPSWTGLAILFLGIVIWEYGIWPGRNDFLSDFGIVTVLFGVVVLVCGWGVMRIAWFPIAFLVCMIPWTPLLYSSIAWPLQLLAAKVSVWTLKLTGVNAYDNGATKIFIGGGLGEEVRTLNVEEACAGLRSLMTFISVAAAVAFLSGRPLWQKIIMTVSAVPIAIACNVVRIAGQGLLDTYWSREMSEGFAHQFVGMVMLAPAFFLIMLVGWLLDNLFVEEADERAVARRVARDATSAAPAAVRMGAVPASARRSQDREQQAAGAGDNR